MRLLPKGRIGLPEADTCQDPSRPLATSTRIKQGKCSGSIVQTLKQLTICRQRNRAADKGQAEDQEVASTARHQEDCL
jgi:hypothetical protein